MSYEFYKVLHIVSMIAVFIALTGYLYSGKKGFGMLHGTALFIGLVGGFGALAKMGQLSAGIPSWIWIKLVVWLVLGGSIALAKRKALPAHILITSWWILGLIAVYAAVIKP